MYTTAKKVFPETMSFSGAAWIAAKIEKYWKARGYAVNIRIEERFSSSDCKITGFDVRSDMVGGRPTRRL